MHREMFALLFGLSLVGCSNLPESQPTALGTSIPKGKIETGISVARIQEKEGNLRQALTMYEELHRSDPKNADVCHRLVVVYTRMDQPEKAKEFFQIAQTLKPNNPELYADFGYACYLRGEMTEAETWLKKAHEMHPKDKRVTGNLALVVGMQGRMQESLTYYRQYLDDAEAHANVGYIFTQRGELEEARSSYTKALSLNPKLKSAQNALLQLADHASRPKKTTAENSPEGFAPPLKIEAKSNWQPTGSVSIRS